MGDAPISAELWQRLRKLDARCSISFEWDGSEWSVVVTARDIRPWQNMQSSSLNIGEAIAGAVEASERRGWHKPYFS